MVVEHVAQPQRLRVEIQGAVQGVGFRPFVYRLATELDLTGWIMNDTHGVFIEVEGPPPDVTRFCERLRVEAPPRALMHTMRTIGLDRVGDTRFEIRRSQAHGAKTTLILPDIGPCAACLAEVCTAADRRFHYPFTNCTNCGPRFTIIQALPYDRSHTTMRSFTLCATCQSEYDDPGDRRFHAQPNACPVCGPQLSLWLPDGATLATGNEALERSATALRHGRIIAVKGLGGFHLMVDASNAKAIARLRQRKRRGDKPFALMYASLAAVQTQYQVSALEARLLSSAETPIVLLRPKPRLSPATYRVPHAAVAPGNPTRGVMLPSTPLHHLLLRHLDFPAVATSGNRIDEPISIDDHDALQRLRHIADLFLVHDRPIVRHVDDSIVRVLLDEPQLLRRARGYAPLPVVVPHALPPILGVGAHLKNTIALSVGRHVFLSQYLGDLATPEALAAFERVIADFRRLYEVTPVAMACDLHPDYFSTRWAQEHTLSDHLPLIPVQHHHAHLAACLAEHGEPGPALGVTWDGTGYGSDGAVWGGEFLLGTPAEVVRVAHLRPFRLPGGEAAVREPRRSALALLWELYGERALAWDDLAPVRAFRRPEQRLLAQMLSRNVNTPITTSAGRLFDAMAALLGLYQHVTFEGQAAMALEFMADTDVKDAYPIVLRTHATVPPLPSSPLVLDWQPLVEAVLEDLRRGVPPGIIAARFHNALVEAILAVVRTVGESRVALTGGCFQNQLLAERAALRLREMGCTVLLHRLVPPNDGGVSLGQVVVAAAEFMGQNPLLNTEIATCASAYLAK